PPGGSLTVGGIKATPGDGQQTLDVTDFGLGVGTAGAPDMYLAGNESGLFTFTRAPPLGVPVPSRSVVNPNNASPFFNLEGFDADGNSLGTVTFKESDLASASGLNVSAKFGGAALSGFRISGNGSTAGIIVTTIRFGAAMAPDTTAPTVTATADKR